MTIAPWVVTAATMILVALLIVAALYVAARNVGRR